ncbi:hypothetical protein WJX73_009430 [Symbiochloris irregularis]|uniref:F-box domain-containing protein n=1 Tax=Symbiochloris irregularis TaxID=706552 RepID=A0AAW1NRD8_9CHLO
MPQKDQAPEMALPLPNHLTLFIFKRLPFEDKIRCQSVCKNWNLLLRQPSDQSVWGAVLLDLDKTFHLANISTRPTPLELDELSFSRFLPVSRWLDVRKTGVSGLSIRLSCCSAKSPPPCRHLHRYLAVFLSSLHSVPNNVHLNFSCAGQVEGLATLPQLTMIEFDYVQVGRGNDSASGRDLIRDMIGKMTKLRALTIRTSACEVRGHDLHRLTALTLMRMFENEPGFGRVLTLPSTLCNLQELDLATNYLERLPGNLSSLSQLTFLDMTFMSWPNRPPWSSRLSGSVQS